MAQISLTVHVPQIRNLKPLIYVEEYLEELLDFSDYAEFRLRKCAKTMERLRNFPLDEFTLRQHRRVLELLGMVSKIGIDIPPGDKLFKPFSSLRKQARIQFNEYKAAGGFRNGEEMWKDVGRYKMILAQMPAKLCYLATEDVLNVMRPILLTLKQHQMFEYCRMLRTVEEFDRSTNIRELIRFELRYYILTVETVDEDIFDEIEKLDMYVETIFKEFIQLPEAFCWTLLQYLDLSQPFQQSNLVYICMGQPVPPGQPIGLHVQPQEPVTASEMPPAPLQANGYVVEANGVSATAQFDAHGQALATVIYQRFLDYMNQIKPEGIDDDTVTLPTLEHFIEFLQINKFENPKTTTQVQSSTLNDAAKQAANEADAAEAHAREMARQCAEISDNFLSNVKVVEMKPSISLIADDQNPKNVIVNLKSPGMIMNRNIFPQMPHGFPPPGRVFRPPKKDAAKEVSPTESLLDVTIEAVIDNVVKHDGHNGAPALDESAVVLLVEDSKPVNGTVQKSESKNGVHVAPERNANRPRGRKNRRHHRK